MNTKKNFFKKALLFSAAFILSTTGCSSNPNISILPSTDNFTQNGNEITAKMDILWIIDNSGSMIEEQRAIRDNLNSFITEFAQRDFDFRVAVTTTDAWATGDYSDMPSQLTDLRPTPYTFLDDFSTTQFVSASCDGSTAEEFTQGTYVFSSQFRDGNVNYGEVIGGSTVTGAPTGYPIISSVDDNITNGGSIDFSLTSTGDGDTDSTDDVETIFGQNILQGVCGSGRESGLRSLLSTLDNPANVGFPRADAHLAIIVVTDEEDNITSVDPDPNTDFTVAKIDEAIKAKLTGDLGYSFHTIAVLSSEDNGQNGDAAANDGITQCRTDSSTSGFQAHFGTRYEALSDLSGGLKVSLCSDFSESLGDIAQTILETTTEFKLTDTPADPNGLVVSIKNAGETEFTTVPQSSVNGWTYNAENNSIIFNGTAVPGQNAEISIIFDPNSL